jgi:hypothetical protein
MTITKKQVQSSPLSDSSQPAPIAALPTKTQKQYATFAKSSAALSLPMPADHPSNPAMDTSRVGKPLPIRSSYASAAAASSSSQVPPAYATHLQANPISMTPPVSLSLSHQTYSLPSRSVDRYKLKVAASAKPYFDLAMTRSPLSAYWQGAHGSGAGGDRRG